MRSGSSILRSLDIRIIQITWSIRVISTFGHDWGIYRSSARINKSCLGVSPKNIVPLHSEQQKDAHRKMIEICITNASSTFVINSNIETLEIIRQHVQAEVSPRSTRLNPSAIPPKHDLVKAGLAMTWETYGSPTLSDQSLLPCPSIKVGPGDSARSHTADEFIHVQEVRDGVNGYIEWLGKFLYVN